MTLSTTNRKKFYNGNDLATVFPYDFRILADTHLVVVLTDAAGVDTAQTIVTDYTVDGVGDSGGGNVTMLVAPATGEQLTIYRQVPQTQTTDFQNQGPFSAESHEDALDKVAMTVQEVAEEVNRAVKVEITDSTTTADELLQSILDAETNSAASAANAASSAATAVAAAASATPPTVSNTNDVAGNYTITDVDEYHTVRATSGPGTITITLPVAANNAGREIVVKKMDAVPGNVVVDTQGGDLIDGVSSITFTEQYQSWTLQSSGSGWDIL